MDAAGKQQTFHNAHARAHRFKVGDKVYVYKQTSVEGGKTTKLKYNWSGPFRVARWRIVAECSDSTL